MPAREDDHLYYQIRERQARALAERAADPGVQAIHMRFAEAYARRARAEAARGSVAA